MYFITTSKVETFVIPHGIQTNKHKTSDIIVTLKTNFFS